MRLLIGAFSALTILGAAFPSLASNCGSAPPSGQVAVRIGFLSAGETNRIRHIQNELREKLDIQATHCYLHAGALPPIPLLEMPGHFNQREADVLVERIKNQVSGVRVYTSNETADSDWGDRRIPQ